MNIWAGKLERNQQCLAAIGLVQKTLGKNAAGVLGQPVQLLLTETTQLETIKTKLSVKVHPISD